mmetsp:Transcript_28713/g.45646  ORF Transcript_28713/g.45646 Transcript_28713/m.45646 type:complete len:206 (-) Transcript_28713:308-925(-)
MAKTSASLLSPNHLVEIEAVIGVAISGKVATDATATAGAVKTGTTVIAATIVAEIGTVAETDGTEGIGVGRGGVVVAATDVVAAATESGVAVREVVAGVRVEVQRSLEQDRIGTIRKTTRLPQTARKHKRLRKQRQMPQTKVVMPLGQISRARNRQDNGLVISSNRSSSSSSSPIENIRSISSGPICIDERDDFGATSTDFEKNA